MTMARYRGSRSRTDGKSVFLAAALVLASVGVSVDARAEDPTKEQCISANEDAQSLRAKNKLQAARAQLLVCVAKSCPTAIRDDCSERLNDIEIAVPTVVFTEKGGDTDLSAVKVTMDGVVVATRLDGAALTVEPGEHAFEFTAEGYAPVIKTFWCSATQRHVASWRTCALSRSRDGG